MHLIVLLCTEASINVGTAKETELLRFYRRDRDGDWFWNILIWKHWNYERCHTSARRAVDVKEGGVIIPLAGVYIPLLLPSNL